MSDLENVSDYNHKDPHITITGIHHCIPIFNSIHFVIQIEAQTD